MTDKQKEGVRHFLRTNFGAHVHHGDCIGADEEFHQIAIPLVGAITIHPPTDTKFQANCYEKYGYPATGAKSLMLLPRKRYLDRNRGIVNATNVLVAAPAQKIELLRSGTWSTIRYAVAIGCPVYILYPDGSSGVK